MTLRRPTAEQHCAVDRAQIRPAEIAQPSPNFIERGERSALSFELSGEPGRPGFSDGKLSGRRKKRIGEKGEWGSRAARELKRDSFLERERYVVANTTVCELHPSFDLAADYLHIEIVCELDHSTGF